MQSLKLGSLLPTLQTAVENELQQVFQKYADPGTPQLYQMLAYHLGWEGPGAGPEAQGKRIRPVLVLLTMMATGKEWAPALPAAAAVELVHNFSLIHDDIQDRSPLRRGRPTVWTRWGEAQAINAGDSMFTLANASILRLAETTEPQTAVEASRILQQTCIHLTQGQHLDLSYENRLDLTVEDYWLMIGGKTAALLAACTELGALVSGVDNLSRSAFRNFGWNLGLAFQVQDDWLGIWGDAALTGKSAESDLISGKKTLPVLYSLGKGEAFAKRWLEGSITSKDVARLSQLLVEEGAQEYAEQAADRLIQESLMNLRLAAPEEPLRTPLEELALKLLNRKS